MGRQTARRLLTKKKTGGKAFKQEDRFRKKLQVFSDFWQQAEMGREVC